MAGFTSRFILCVVPSYSAAIIIHISIRISLGRIPGFVSDLASVPDSQPEAMHEVRYTLKHELDDRIRRGEP